MISPLLLAVVTGKPWQVGVVAALAEVAAAAQASAATVAGARYRRVMRSILRWPAAALARSRPRPTATPRRPPGCTLDRSPWYSGYSPTRGFGEGARIACAGQGLSLTAVDQC